MAEAMTAVGGVLGATIPAALNQTVDVQEDGSQRELIEALPMGFGTPSSLVGTTTGLLGIAPWALQKMGMIGNRGMNDMLTDVGFAYGAPALAEGILFGLVPQEGGGIASGQDSRQASRQTVQVANQTGPTPQNTNTQNQSQEQARAQAGGYESY